MKIITTKEDFEEAYYYDKKYLREEDYPTHYPCIMEVYEFGGGLWGGGLGGSGKSHVFIYSPNLANPTESEIFLAGYAAGKATQYKYDL